MTDIDQLKGTPFEDRSAKKTIPGNLNILTILTFIGSGVALIMAIFQQFTAKSSLEAMEKMQGSEALEKMPEFAKKMYSNESIELLRVSYENRVPILVITIVGILLCVYGAMQMRGLKKQGFYLWLIGELLPLIGTVIFVGTGIFSGFVGYISLAIIALFIFLYARQLKYLR